MISPRRMSPPAYPVLTDMMPVHHRAELTGRAGQPPLGTCRSWPAAGASPENPVATRRDPERAPGRSYDPRALPLRPACPLQPLGLVTRAEATLGSSVMTCRVSI